jgi:hypothetical protein
MKIFMQLIKENPSLIEKLTNKINLSMFERYYQSDKSFEENFRSCLSYYFLIEIELFLVELDFNF